MLTIIQALQALKEGKKVRRLSWITEGNLIYLKVCTTKFDEKYIGLFINNIEQIENREFTLGFISVDRFIYDEKVWEIAEDKLPENKQMSFFD